MDPRLAELLREIEEQYRQHGGLPGLAREVGQFLNLQAKITRATRILEVGTGDGYGTLWLAEAAAANDGQVTTLEDDLWQGELVKDILARSPHIERIQALHGDLAELLSVLEGPFDFVLLDAERSQALHYFRVLIEKIPSGGVICCDKAISMAGVLADYLTFVHENNALESVLIPIGDGIEVTYKVP